MTTLPFLRLPKLALVESLKSMRLVDLVELSTTSAKMCNLIKLGTRKRYRLSMEAFPNCGYVNVYGNGESYRFDIAAHKSYSIFKPRARQFGNQIVLFDILGSTSCEANFDDVTFGISAISSHLIRNFGCQIHKVEIEAYFGQREITEFIGYLGQTEITLAEGDAKTALSTLKRLLSLYVRANSDRSFQFSFGISPKEISIKKSEWFRVKDLSELSFEKLFLNESMFSNEDIDILVKNWKAGQFPNLKHLVIESSLFKNGYPFDGMMPSKLAQKAQNWKGFLTCVDIETNGGAKGKIMLNTNAKLFSLFVRD